MKTKHNIRFYLLILSGVLILLFSGTTIPGKGDEIRQCNMGEGIDTKYPDIQQSGDYVTDIDNNRYKIVKIGTQTWMAENLKTTKYRNGTSIELVTNSEKWQSTTSGAYCFINNTRKTLRWQGVLYNGAAITNSAGICPAGWRIPTQADMQTLQSNLGGQGVAGGKMKSTGSALWQSPNTGATNESGFSAKGDGYRLPNGNYSSYKQSFRFWASNRYGNDNLYFGDLNYGNSKFEISAKHERHGLSVRCIKN